MKNVSVVRVKVAFPFGGHFYDNIDELTYKLLLNYLHKMTCVVPNCKCNECERNELCRYYQITGENFKKYPGIFMKIDLFSKTLFKAEEEYEFVFILIGNMKKYYSYIEVFFKSYLEQRLATHPFYLKSINKEELQSNQKLISELSNQISLTTKPFHEVYNDFVSYYNEKYECDFSKMNEAETMTIVNKKCQYPNIKLKTCIRKRNGYFKKLQFFEPVNIDEALLYIGIGKLNDIGGGYFEN